MTLLGLDVGEKRIGVARSDELNLMAHRLGFIERRSEPYVLQMLKRYADEFGADRVVVGLPKTLKGETGPQAEKVLAFIARLKALLPYPIVTWDERLTTVQAERALIGQDVSRAKRKMKLDAVAAELILQSYLDFSRRKENKNFRGGE